MLSSISDNWEEDETNEGLRDMGGLDERVDRVNEEFGADGDCEGYDNKNAGGSQDGPRLLGATMSFLSQHLL